MSTIAFKSDPERTKQRFSNLQRYFARNVFNERKPRRDCKFCKKCTHSHQGFFFYGKLHHVGDHYDLSLGGRPLRITVVAQDDNEKTEYKSLSDRSGEVRSSGQRPFSSETSDLSDKAGSRNRHMKGTTSLLRLIFKIGLGCDWQGEFLQINGKRVHIFDAFALLNSSPCTAERPSGSAKPTNTMLQNCSNHLKAALEELAPTMIVAEGNLAAEALRMAGYGSEKSPTIERISTSYGPIMLLKFKHPSARGKFNWGSNERMPIY